MPVSDDASELQPLTPAHFLIQRCSFLVPEPDYSITKVTLSKRWKLVSQMAQHIWQRWSAEYLTSLQLRNKWQRTDQSLQAGDLVIIKNEISPPGRCPLGRVIEVHHKALTAL